MTFLRMVSEQTRMDPIRKNFFQAIERAEWASKYLFYLGALTSFAPLLLDKQAAPDLYRASLVVFVLATFAIFVTGIATRLYFFPRAEDARRKEFVSNCFGFSLIHQRTFGYYNNDETNPHRRMGLSLLENLFFSKNILRSMAPMERTKAAIYVLTWVAALAWGSTPPDWIAAGTQVLFSEELVSRLLRLEWARSRAERLYDATYRVFQADPADANRLQAMVVDSFGDYEAGKALAGILLSEKEFKRLNADLTTEWEAIKAGLPIRAIEQGP